MQCFMKDPQIEGEIQQRRFFVVQVKCPSLMTKRTCYVRHRYRVLDVEFQEDTSNSRQDTSETVHCCLLLLINRDQAFKCCRPL